MSESPGPCSDKEETMWDLSLRERMKHVNPLVVLLVICFAFSSWIDMYGVFVEIPILVHALPEGWTFPSYVIVLVECAMISPLLYALINMICPGNVHRREVVTAYVIMGVGLTALILLTIFWDRTVWIAGAERSLAHMLLILLLAMVDTTSCIVYLPYMARFKEFYMPAYVAGEEMGGLITGLVGLIQGAGGEMTCSNQSVFIMNETTGENYTMTELHVSVKEPLFSVSVFYIFLSFMMLVSMLSFSMLNFSPFAKREMVHDETYRKLPTTEEKHLNDKKGVPVPHNELFQNESSNIQVENNIWKKQKEAEMVQMNGQSNDIASVPPDNSQPQMARGRLYYCCAVYVWAAFLVYGIFPSIHSYSMLPYGALAYTLAVRLVSVVNPCAALSAFFFPILSLNVLSVLVAFSSSLVAFHIFLASKSPTPPLQEGQAGMIIGIVTSFILCGVFAYTRACLATVMRKEGGHRALFLCGASIQLGAFMGGILGFILVTVLQVFDSIPGCA